MSFNALYPQKRQIIDCNQQLSKLQHHDNNKKKYNSLQDFNEMNKKYEAQKYQTALNNDLMSRVTLLQSQNRNALLDGDQNILNRDVFGVKTSIQRVKKSSDFQDMPISQSLTSRTYKSTRYDWLKNQNGDSDNNNQNYSFYGNNQLQSHNNYSNNLVTDRDLKSHYPYKFKSLSNIDPYAAKLQNKNQVESVNIVSNKGRYIVHQKVKKTIDQNPLPSAFFTTPQYKTSKVSAYSQQDIPSNLLKQNKSENKNIIYFNKVSQNPEVASRKGMFQSFYNQPKQSQNRFNLKNDKIFEQFIPCFSTSQPMRPPQQIPMINQNQIINQSNNQSNIFSQKNSFHQNHTKSSQNLEQTKDNNQNSKNYYQIRSSQNFDEERKKEILQLQNELSLKFDELNSIFTENTQDKRKNLKNNIQNFQISKVESRKQQQKSEQRRESDSLNLSGDQTSTTQEQNGQLNETSFCKNRNEFTKENIQDKDLNDQFRKFSTATVTDQLDSSSNQEDVSLKNSHLDNFLDDNINDEIKSNLNENENIINDKKQGDSQLDKKDLNFMINGNGLVASRKVKLQELQQKREKNNSYYNIRQNNGINTFNSLSFLDEVDNSCQSKINFKKYHASSYTKLPSTCQLGRISSRNNQNSQKQIQSYQEIPIQKNIPLIDEKKMLEDYRQYQIRNKLDIKSKCVSVYDVDNSQFILSVQGNKFSQIASLTKIMTCYIVCDLLNRTTFKKNDPIKISLSKTQTVKISKIAAKMKGTSAFLRSGDQLTLWSLLHGLMLPSGNDAAFAISEQIGSIIYETYPLFQAKKHQNSNIQYCNPKEGQKEFINVMNMYAERMKLKNTHYSNPHGLNNNKNKSCSNDLCILVNNAMKNPYFREIVSTKEYTAQIVNHTKGNRESTWENTQKLLKKNKYCNGVKTGVTTAAGPCLASSFCINNRNFIIVILKTTSMEMRFTETMQVFKFIVETYELDKEQEEEIKQELNYQPDQDDVIEKKFLKPGWNITSANNIISTNDLNEEKDSSDENFDGFEEDDDENDDDQNISNFDNIRLTNNNLENKSLEQDVAENNSLSKENESQDKNQTKIINQGYDDKANKLSPNSSFSRENIVSNNSQRKKIQNQNKLDNTNPQSQKFQELLRSADKNDDSLNELNQSSSELINIQEQNQDGEKYNQYDSDQQLKQTRAKKLTKINEENI